VDSSAVISGQRVVVGSTDGNLYVIDLNKGTEIQKIDLGSPIVASPAVSNGRLVIGTTNGAVYCLGKK
jgi:outer membrane protein assembly factor BamB